MNPDRFRARRRRLRIGLAAAAWLGTAGGCDQRQPLLGPGPDPVPEDAPQVVLPTDSVVTLREGDLVRIGLQGGDAGRRAVRVGLLLLDSTRVVLWRSPTVRTDSSAAHVPTGGIPPELVDRGPLLLTASAEGPDGRRVFPGGGDRPAGSLRDAAVRAARVRTGRVVEVGGRVNAVAADPETGRLYFSRVGSGEVSVMDLSARALGPVVARDGGEIGALAWIGEFLVYLADAGSRVVFLPTAGRGDPREAILGPLDVVVARTFAPSGTGSDTVAREDVVRERVRPYGLALRAFCGDTGTACEAPVAVVSSRTQGGGGVLRLVPYREGPPLIAPGFLRLPGGADTVQASVVVRGPRRPDGDPELLLSLPGVAGCVLLRLGTEGFAVGPGGRLFAASGPSCGPAGRVVRVDGVGGMAPQIARLASETFAAEDRIGTPRQVIDAPDGSRLLLRDEKGVWLLDSALRVLGFRPLPAGAAVTWVLGGPAESPPRFVIVEGGRARLYEADRFGLLGEVGSGPLEEAPLAAVRLPSGASVLVGVPAESRRMVAVIPLPSR